MQKQLFSEIKENIPMRTLEQGDIIKKRKERVRQALQNLTERTERTEKKIILGFLPARNLSFDFYVVFVHDRYKISHLSVSDRYWLEAKKKMYPENIVIAVDLIETLESIENKILRAIAAKKRRWLLKSF